MQLRPEQEQIINQIEASILFGSTNIIVDAHVSFGKSLIMSELAKRLDSKIVIMVNITPLINQIAEHLDEVGLSYSILKAGYEDKFDPDNKIQLIMSQTFYAREDKLQLEADYLIIDERHKEYNTQRTNKLISHLNPKAIIGFTGTPFDQAGYILEDSEILNASTIQHSERMKYIVPLKYYVPKWITQLDLSEIDMSGSDYSERALDEVINTDTHTDLVIKSMNQMNAKNKKTLVFCNSIEHCDNITLALKRDGYNVGSVHSKKNSKENDAIMLSYTLNKPLDILDGTLFESEGNDKGVIKCLVSVSKLNTGFSVKDIELGVSLRPTKVRSLYIQTLGRLIRSYENKEFAEFLDLANVTSEHGFHFEDYIPPEKGMKKELKELKTNHAIDCINLITEEEPTYINTENVKAKIEELRLDRENVEELADIDKLNYIFENSYEPYDIVRIAGIIGNRFRGLPVLSKSNIKFISEEWDILINDNEIHRNRILKTLRTMAKNKVQQKKKLVALHYSPEWLKSVNSEYF